MIFVILLPLSDGTIDLSSPTSTGKIPPRKLLVRMPPAKPNWPHNPDVLSIWLSGYHSLDVVHLPKQRKFRVVLAERFGVQRRAFVEINYEQAVQLARHLVVVDNATLAPRVGSEEDQQFKDEPTNPGKPTNRAPTEILEMVKILEGELGADDSDSVVDPSDDEVDPLGVLKPAIDTSMFEKYPPIMDETTDVVTEPVELSVVEGIPVVIEH